ncbi:MAG: putative phosphate transport regulator [Dehalococcoidia bacterium]|nr:putative phosphate transport regulator [Dehalococcoidia bacterium]
MKLSFLPREDKFFTLLQQSASNLTVTAAKLRDLMESYENVGEKVAEIKRLEEAGDNLIHTIMKSLHLTFITPLDREDIALLGERLDDVVDSIEEVARNMLEYRIERPTEKAKEMARIILGCAETLEKAMGLLHHRGAKLKDLLPLTVEVNRLENEADQITSQAIGELFNNGIPPIEVIKWKEVYDQLENATDRCEDIANVLEGIVLKNA